MVAQLAHLLLALLITAVLLGGGLLGVGAIMVASAEHGSELAAKAKADRQAAAFIRIMDHCEANPGDC